jgi:hypothetical protein
MAILRRAPVKRLFACGFLGEPARIVRAARQGFSLQMEER